MRHLTRDCSRRIVCNELMALFCSNIASKLQKTNSTRPNHAAMIKQYRLFLFLSPFLSLIVCSFPESGQPICGNGMVEANEQCDCGYSDQCKDTCCYSANEKDELKCRLKPNARCRCVRTLTVCCYFYFKIKLLQIVFC